MSLLPLAQWAFRPNGLPDLQILAYDCFKRETSDRDSVLICRRTLVNPGDPTESTFRLVTSPGDQDLWDVIGNHVHVSHCFSTEWTAPPW